MYRLVYYRYFMNFSESINFKSISTVSNNVKSNGFHKNTIKPNNYGLKNDTVEINKNDSSQNDSKKSKLLKWGAIIGCAIAATTIGVLAKKKITAKNAKKSAEELEKLKRQELERVRAEELKKTEEARIAKEQALKAQHEAREKAVQEAKAKAEQEAKIKAEKEAEAARIAKENADKKIIDDLFKDFDEQLGAEKLKSHISYNDEINQPNVFENGIVNTLKKAEDKGISQDKIENLYQTIAEKNSLNDTQIKGISGSSNLLPYESDFAKYELRSRRQLFDGVETLKETTPQKEGEKYSEYIKRLISTHKSNVESQNEAHIKRIRDNIHYSDVEPPKAELTDDELKILQEWRPEEYKDKSKEEALQKLSGSCNFWTRGYTSEAKDGGLPEDVEHILLSKAFPRYNSQTDLFRDGHKRETITPVARWMNITGLRTGETTVNDAEKYIDETFKVGQKYVAPSKQSCSMDLRSAHDADFCDTSANELKFIIHPKSATSKAANIASATDHTFQYGHFEVIYPKGTEFNVLDKRLEEVELRGGDKYYRWVVEMQEA